MSMFVTPLFHAFYVLSEVSNVLTLTLIISPIKGDPTSPIPQIDREKAYQECEDHLKNNKNTVVATHLPTVKRRGPFINLARQYQAQVKFIYLYHQPSADLKNDTIEPHLLRQYRLFQMPTYSEDIDVIEIRHSVEILEDAARYVNQHEQMIIGEPHGFLDGLRKADLFEKWIPEYVYTVGLNQHNPHHSFTVYEHIRKASSFVAGTSLKIAWTLLLHDIGKAFPGIKQFYGSFLEPYRGYEKRQKVVIENGESIRDGIDVSETYRVDQQYIPKDLIRTDLAGHFYDHENIGAQMALGILLRLGYSVEFAHEVATLIQHHMSMPRNTETIEAKKLKNWYSKVGRYAADLMMVRLADNRGKFD